MPTVFEPTVGKKEEGRTHIQVFTGPGTLFDVAKKITFREITSGTSNTVLAIEAKEPVVWTKPADLQLPKEKTKMPAVGGLFPDGFHVLMCDGSVRMMALDTTPAVLRRIVNPRSDD